MMVPYGCSVCGRPVTSDDQYVIRHALGPDDSVIHLVFHKHCHENPWAEGNKTAAPAQQEQEHGE
jgi:hypothetical protein